MFPNHAFPYAFICSAYVFTDTEICEHTIIWHSSEGTKIGTVTKISKSTNFGTFTKVPFTGIFSNFGISTNTGTGNLRYRYQYQNTDNNFVPLQYQYQNTG